MQETGTRINKYMSQCGYCSRREADRLIEKGEVWDNGTFGNNGNKSDARRYGKWFHHTTITLAKKNIFCISTSLHGIVCTTSKIDKNNVIDYLNFPERIYR